MHLYKKLFITSICLFSFSYNAFALGEAVTEMADKIGDKMGIGLTRSQIDASASTALQQLLATSPAAKALAKEAKGILIYPEIIKAGMGVGGHHGEGVLRKNGKSVAYYNTIAGSYGLQMGAQKFGYALFFMNDKALAYLNKSEGWEVGVGPSVVIVDEGMAKTLTTTTAKKSVYVFTFNQKGLMAGMGIQGSKITKINPKK